MLSGKINKVANAELEMRPNSNIGPTVPAFLRKLWKIVNDPMIDDLVGWSTDGESFVIRNPPEFCYNLLPIYYKHNNMSSFIRQLNMYGFHKISNENGCDKDEIRFFHPFFQQNEARLLQHIKRKIGATKTEDKKLPLDHIGKVLSDVKQLKGKQETVDNQLSSMKQENAALWRELALLRQKHMKQQQIVNKLIHFLVSIVQQPSRTTIGVKRHFPLMLNDGPASKTIRRTDPTTTEGATIHEIDTTDSQRIDEPICEVLIDDVPIISSPNVTSPMVDTTDILDNILVDNMENENLEVDGINNEPSVADLLQESDDIDFSTPDLEEVVSDEINADTNILPDLTTDLNEEIIEENVDSLHLDDGLQTPQIMLTPDGKSIIDNSPKFDAKKLANIKKEPEMAVATRNNADKSKLINNVNDFGLHVSHTQGELDTIKDMLFDGGVTLDANAFLDLFNSNDSLPIDVNTSSFTEEDWGSASDNQLFNGSELISYNPNDVLNFNNLLEETEEEG